MGFMHGFRIKLNENIRPKSIYTFFSFTNVKNGYLFILIAKKKKWEIRKA